MRPARVMYLSRFESGRSLRRAGLGRLPHERACATHSVAPVHHGSPCACAPRGELTGEEGRVSDRAEEVREALRQFAVAEVRLLVDEAGRIKDHEPVEDLHDVMERVELLAARRVRH